MEFRTTTILERKEFYNKEFDVKKVKNWFKNKEAPQLCAIDAGSDSGIIIDKKLKNYMLYFHFSELSIKIKKYWPEDIYYDRNIYADPKMTLKNLEFEDAKSQELAFDVDADNIICNHSKKEMVCYRCLDKAFKAAIEIKNILDKSFKKVNLVYSGRGFHIHVLDKKAYKLSVSEREEWNKKLKKFPIDPWVSRGYIRLIRMPFTLNCLVSRIVTPLSKTNQFNEDETIPKFMKD